MEKKVKDIYKIECNWYMHPDEDYLISPIRVAEKWSEDLNGLVKGSWEGKIVSFEDNSCIGYAKNSVTGEPDQLLIGTILDKKAISLTKISRYEYMYDPLLFHNFSNSLANSFGKTNNYYGQFISKTFDRYQEMGTTSIKAKVLSKTKQNDALRILADSEMLTRLIRENNSFGSMFLNMIVGLNQNNTNLLLEDEAKMLLHADLPIELQEEIINQLEKQ